MEYGNYSIFFYFLFFGAHTTKPHSTTILKKKKKKKGKIEEEDKPWPYLPPSPPCYDALHGIYIYIKPTLHLKKGNDNKKSYTLLQTWKSLIMLIHIDQTCRFIDVKTAEKHRSDAIPSTLEEELNTQKGKKKYFNKISKLNIENIWHEVCHVSICKAEGVLPEASQNVDEEMEQIVVSIEKLTADQTLQVEVSREEIAVVEEGGDRGRWLVY